MIKKCLLGLLLTTGILGSSFMFNQTETAGDEIFPPLLDEVEPEVEVIVDLKV
ncbi:hypothetical protein AAEO50_00850 [Rossellomorea oryzaecorticis]|uniref:Uncharacterized protein n=1 Tax=Rossellomorea oryzaecorticis TaxID=1396505 RepID=A0ABU9K3Y8_9BACI